LDFLKRLKPKPNRRSRARRKQTGAQRGKSSRSRKARIDRWSWVLGLTAVAVVLSVGLLNWMHSRQGQATLLTLGSDKMYDEVQAAVDAALVSALPDFKGGPATAAADHDWPAPDFGPGAKIRCRRVTVSAAESWWEIQARVADVVSQGGARVLWGERLLPARLGRDQLRPNEELDLLRLDLGVSGRPTHTLILARDGVPARVQWGGGPGQSRWDEFAGGEAPTVALIIDDWGHGKTGPAMDLLKLKVPLTLAVLPDLPYSRYFSLQRTELVLPPDREPEATANAPAVGHATAGNQVSSGREGRLQAGCPVEVSLGRRRSAWTEKRREIMLHLPMQPQGYPATDPGPKAVLVGMSAAEIRDRLNDALASLTNVTGVNNHMGSAATSDLPTMSTLMSLLRERDLFFVDSLTSARSVAYHEAVRAGIPAARNRIFLDYDSENEITIAANLAQLVRSARSAGFAVGIGHPHRATAAVLAREIPRLMKEGVRFVTVSELLALRDFRDVVVVGVGGE